MSIDLTTGIGDFSVKDGYGLLLTEIAQRAGLQLNTRCGGAGACGGCACKLGKGDYVIQDRHVTVEDGGYQVELACQTRVVSETAEVHFPRTSIVEQAAQIDQDFTLQPVKGVPLSRKVFLKIPPPSLEHAVPDWQRVQQLLESYTGLKQPGVPLDVLRRLPSLLADGENKITVTVGRKNSEWTVIDVEPGDTTGRHFGVAVDIGTTTVAAMLVDLDQGVVTTRASMYNQQISKADDVASRISYCRTSEQLDEMQDLVVNKTINELIDTLCRPSSVNPRHIVRMVVSGNTVMSHLFLGLSPEGIGTLPFQPVTNEHRSYLASQLGLSVHPNGIVEVVPSVAGYVGGDITSDIYIAKIHKHPEPTLMVDIGTNGEIIFSEGTRMVACATAAGPAFEGAGITHGCRAAAGAIERVRYDDRLEFDLKVIGGAQPNGLCGSGIIDFLAEGLRCGLISSMGRFDREMVKAGGAYLDDQALCGNSVACVIADRDATGTGSPLFVTELDISQLMKAKAAIYAGMKTLLGTQGKRFADIQRFCLAGGFARYIDLRNAITIGLLPEIPVDRYEIIGNGSLAGAFLALIEAEATEAYKGLIHVPEIVELNLEKAFEPHFVDALALPNLDPDDFPETNASLPVP